MKKIFAAISVLLVIAFVITGCGTSTASTTTPAATNPATTTPAETTPAATTSASTTPAATTTAAITPAATTPAATTNPDVLPLPAMADNAVSGGTLRIITSFEPHSLGYGPQMNGTDQASVYPVVERLLDASSDRTQGDGMTPVLASSIENDIANNDFIVHIRPNINFSDGTPLNADAVIWNFDQYINSNALEYQNFFKAIKKIDDMTVEVDYTTYNNQLEDWFYFVPMMSPTAFEKASGGNLQTGENWALTHVVGTGPFILQNYQQSVSMTFVKNPNYWQPGLPFLDGIQVTFITDETTAENMLMAGQADEWDSPTAQGQAILAKNGFNLNYGWAGIIYDLYPNTVNPKSPFYNNLKLREAVEYALDRPAIAKALGFGYFEPLDQLAPKGEWGYDPNYQAPTYDPAKAKQLLAEAGYPNGLKISLLIGNDPASIDAGTAFKQYLDAVGINTTLDEADPGRFYSQVSSKSEIPTDDLTFWMSGMNPTYLTTYFHWFSATPFNYVSFLLRTPEQNALTQEAEVAQTTATQQAATLKVYGYLNENAMVIPIYKAPAMVVAAPYVHTYRMQESLNRWQSELTWMSKH